MSSFLGERIIGETFVLGLTIKQLKHKENSQKQLKTANPNRPWAYILEGLLLDGLLSCDLGHLFLGEFIFGRAYYQNFSL